MTDHTDQQLRALLARLITDGAHHARCAGVSKREEAALVHDGFAAGFHHAAMYTADLLATGNLQWHSAHRVTDDDQTAAEYVLNHLPDTPAERAQLIAKAIGRTASGGTLEHRAATPSAGPLA